MRMMGFNVLKQIAFRLLTKTESLDDSTIAIDVAIIQVIEQCTTLSYKLCQRTCCSIIFTVLLNVLRQMSNTVWATQKIECEMGRVGKSVDGEYHDRIIDIDILIYDDLKVNEPDLVIPHPLMEEREFVMIPLKEIL